MTKFPWRGLLAGLWLLSSAASAHDADILYTQVRRAGPAEAEVRQVVTLTASTLGLLVPADADGDGTVSQADLDARRPALEVGVWDAMPLTAGGQPCTRTSHTALLRQTFVELSATFTCPKGALQQRYTVLSVLPAGYRVILGSAVDGELPGALFADATQPSLAIPGAGEGTSSAVSG
ncbi:HupE/UreJ family protein, partial [Myxococcus sp. AM011]|nr:HupE/UreJ family protein [Myxococcus sp. AM011]